MDTTTLQQRREMAAAFAKSLKPTRRDPDNSISLQAIGCLGAARNLRLTRASWIQDAISQYGWTGPLISGCEQGHWPEDVKDRLRTNAREISAAHDDAFKLWRKAGRQFATLRGMLFAYTVDGSRY